MASGEATSAAAAWGIPAIWPPGAPPLPCIMWPVAGSCAPATTESASSSNIEIRITRRGVIRLSSGYDVIRPHHVVVFVLEDVAVPDVRRHSLRRRRGVVGELELLDDARDQAHAVVGIARERLDHVLPRRPLVGPRRLGRRDEFDPPRGLEEVEVELLAGEHLE